MKLIKQLVCWLFKRHKPKAMRMYPHTPMHQFGKSQKPALLGGRMQAHKCPYCGYVKVLEGGIQ